MARTNKYTSLNFNDIYEKKKIPSPITSPSSKSPSSSLSSSHKSYASTSRHGGMLVLSRPNKPSPSPPLSPSPTNPPPPLASQGPTPTPTATPTPTPAPTHSDTISLRPQGKTGSSFPTLDRGIRDQPSPKSDKFVPPHLRPGFVGREQKAVPPESHRPVGGGERTGNFQPYPVRGHCISPNRNGEDGRPKSGGGGHDHRMRGFGARESDITELSRSKSVGTGYRPISRGW